MRKIYFLCFLLFLAFLKPFGSFAQVVTIPAANTNSGSVNDPLGAWWGYERSAMIYTAAEIGSGGMINSVAFYINSLTSPGNSTDVRIYMKERSDLFTGVTTYATETTGATLVYGPTTVTGASLTAGQWNTFTLTAPFLYTGGNLEVIVETNAGGTGSGESSTGKQFRYATQPSTGYYQNWNGDNSPPAGNGTLSANRPNIQLDMVIPPCVPGSINPGTVVPPASAACPGSNVSLSVTGASFGSGFTYQWESSTDNVTFSPIAGATGSTYTGPQSVSTWYRRTMFCGAGNATSPAVQVLTAAPVSVFPWTENFDGLTTVGATSFPACWRKENGDWRSANNSTTTFDDDARSAPNFIQNSWTATNEFIWTNGFQLTAGVSYDFGFWFSDYNTGFNTWVGEVWQNTVQGSAGASQVGTPFISAGTFAPTTYTQVKRSFIPAVTGTYYFAIRLNEASGNPWYLNFDDFSLSVTPPCTEATGVNLTNVAATSVTINWTASTSNPAGGYEWEIRSSGAAGSGAAGLAASGSTAAGVTTANAAGLAPNTDYQVYVRSVCTAGSVFSPWSAGQSLHTLCLSINTFPYTETFEAASTTRPCWTNSQVGGSVQWSIGAGAGNGGNVTSAHGGTSNARYFGSGSGSIARYVSPSLDLTSMPAQGAQVRFWFANQEWLGDQNELRVFYRTSSAGAWTLVPGAVFTSSVGAWTEAEVMLPGSTTADYQIAFEGREFFGYGVAIDDVTIEAAPSCPKPTNVSALAVTPTAVQVSFTSPGTSFVVEWGPVGFVPGTGNTAGGGTLVFGATSPITVSGLTAATTYDFYVRRECISATDYSVNVKTTATTLCPAVNIPYVQDFETAAPPTGFPTCTSMQDLNGNSGPDANITGGRWVTFAGTSGDTYHSPTRVVRYIYDLPNVTRPADDWFFIQGLNLTGGTTYRLKFFYKASDGPTWTERLEVKYGTEAHAAAMTNTLFTDNNIDGNLAAPWDSAVVEFTPVATNVYYIGFHATSLADQAFLYMDDISVRIAPKVDVGVTGITLPNVTCPVNNVFVQATIRNYNTSTLDFAQYPVTVNANITGASTTTLSTTLTTGTLAPGASMGVYLSPAYNFVGGNHNFKVYTSSPDDPEFGNDTLVTSVTVSPNPAQPVITPASPAICVGGSVQLNTQYTNPPPPPVNLPAVSSGAITVSVPDGSAVGATHSLNVSGVPAGATITGVSVTLNATHTWVSDFVINLRAPNGRVLNLFNAQGGSGDNLVNTVISSASTNPLSSGAAPFTGTYAADMAANVGPTGNASTVTSWNAFLAGLGGNGTWTVALRDLFLFDAGTLTSWSITLSYQFANPVVTWSPSTSLFTNAGLTTPYAGTDAFSVYAAPATTTTYTATATNGAGCTSTRNVTVTVNPNPVITLGNIPDTVCTSDEVIQLPATPIGGTWSGIGTSGNTFVPSATAVGTFNLTYSFTSDAGCTSTRSRQIAVKDCPERIIRLSDNAVFLYPNPNTGQFNIRMNSTLYSYLTMRVYSNTGTLVHTQHLTGLTYGRVVPIDLKNLPGGTYMVQFYYDGGVRTSQKTFKVIIGNP